MSSHDATAPDSAFDYDVLADVSQHGANVFDFFSPPAMHATATMHDAAAAAAAAAAGVSASPLPRSAVEHHPDHHLTALSLAAPMPEIAVPMVTDTKTLPSELTLTSPMPASAAATSSPFTDTKPPSTPRSAVAASASKKRGSPPSTNGIVYSQLINQAESFCTTDSVPKVELPIAKQSISRRARPMLIQDASTDPGSSMHSPSVGDENEPKDVHNSHTRRCRAKVNSKFQELLRILPKPPPKTGVKHKAQILDYTIRVFREIYAKKLYLEAELALSSRAHLNNWVENVVKPATQLADILNPFMSLICTKEKWVFAETWVPVAPPSLSTNASSQDMNTTEASVHMRVTPANVKSGALGTDRGSSLLPSPPVPETPLRLGTTIIPSTAGNFDDPDLQSKLECFRDRSRQYVCKPRVDPPGRIMCTMRPEWLPSLADDEAFQRAEHAKEASLAVCLGVPFFVRGHVAAVVVFYDVAQRPYDAKCVDLAGTIAGLLGNAFGARSEENKSKSN